MYRVYIYPPPRLQRAGVPVVAGALGSIPGGQSQVGGGFRPGLGGGRGGGVFLGPGNPIPRNSVFPSQLLFSTFFLARVPERLFRPKSPKSGPKGTKSEPK